MGFRNQLSDIDTAERAKNSGKLDENYKQARAEMVKIIQNLDDSSLRISKLLQKLFAYKNQLQNSISELGETRNNLEI